MVTIGMAGILPLRQDSATHGDSGATVAPPMRRRCLLAAVAAAALLAGIAPGVAEAGDPIMPLSELRPGMRCTAYSVIRGTEIASFDVEILDVVSGDASANDGPRILVRLSGRRSRTPASGRASPARRCTAATARAPPATPVRSPSRSARSAARRCSRRRSRRSSPTLRGAPPPADRRARVADRDRAAARRAADRLRAQPRARATADRGGREGAPADPGGACAPARPVPTAAAAPRLGAERRLLVRRSFGRRGRHRRLRRRRPRVGLRPRVREQRPALAAAAGRVRLRRDLEPERRRGHRLDLQARRRGTHPRHDLQRRRRGRLGRAGRRAATIPVRVFSRGRGHRRALDARRPGGRRDRRRATRRAARR